MEIQVDRASPKDSRGHKILAFLISSLVYYLQTLMCEEMHPRVLIRTTRLSFGAKTRWTPAGRNGDGWKFEL